jgi:hypothetical protein
MRAWNGSARRAAISLAVAALVAAAVTVYATSAVATSPSKQRISAGVEDGTFSPTCLPGTTTTPDEGVLTAKNYRDNLGSVVRILVPWNIAVNTSSNAYQCLTTYLKFAHQYKRADVEVSLNRVTGATEAPSVGQYSAAVTDLGVLHNYISYVTAWNEPNNPAYLPLGKGTTQNDRATRAGQYFAAARSVFPGKMIGGDFSSGVSRAFLSTYTKNMGPGRPSIWAIHPYTDVTNFQYYLASGMTPQRAGTVAAAHSKVLEFARYLHEAPNNYGSKTRIWLNEIYIDHTADKNPPASLVGKKCPTTQEPNRQCKKGVTTFSQTNQAYAAVFLSDRAADTLHGVLVGTGLPQLGRYIYLRASDGTVDQKLRDADVLEVHSPDCIYYTLAGTTTAPAPQCS